MVLLVGLGVGLAILLVWFASKASQRGDSGLLYQTGLIVSTMIVIPAHTWRSITSPENVPVALVFLSVGMTVGAVMMFASMRRHWAGVVLDDAARAVSLTIILSCLLSLIAEQPLSRSASVDIALMAATGTTSHLWWRIGDARPGSAPSTLWLLRSYALCISCATAAGLAASSTLMPTWHNIMTALYVLSALLIGTYVSRRIARAAPTKSDVPGSIRPALGHFGIALFAFLMSAWLLVQHPERLSTTTVALGAVVVALLTLRYIVTLRDYGTLVSAAQRDEARYRTMITNSSDVILVARESSWELTFASPNAIDIYPAGANERPRNLCEVLDCTPDQLQQAMRALDYTGAVRWTIARHDREYEVLLSHHESLCRATIRDVTQTANYERELQRLACQDRLTGLPTRRQILQELGDQVRAWHPTQDLWIIYADLVGFKSINDEAGHGAGDDVLKQCAGRLRAAAPNSVIIGRLGGDEFLLICRGLAGGDVQTLCEELHRVFAEPFTVGMQAFTISVSLGACSYQGQGGDLALRQADEAMYEAKRAGRETGWAQPGDAMIAQSASAPVSVTAFAAALERQAFEAFAQPIITIETGQIHSWELLLRWRDTSGNQHTPAALVQYAMATGNSGVIMRWMMHQALSCLVDNPTMRVSVNACFADLMNDDLYRNVATAYRSAGVGPGHLIIELSEQEPLRDVESARAICEHLQLAGITIALDDFATGYATIEHFLSLPYDVIKIDRALTSQLTSSAVAREALRGICSAAQTLGRVVVVEGIENLEEAQCVVQCGGRLAQGYLASPPLPLPTAIRHNAANRAYPLLAPTTQPTVTAHGAAS